MNLNIIDWNDITAHLNGYSLDKIIIENNFLYGINSQNEKILLAKPSASYWEPTDGPGYSAMDQLIRMVKSEVKISGNFSDLNKQEILIRTCQEFIRLFHKDYTSLK